jgi:Tol biopolymer transport system component
VAEGKTICNAARTALVLALCAGLTACGGGGGGTPTPPSDRLTLTGTLRDAAATPIAGAAVLLGQSPAATDASGKFSYPNLLPGQYVIALADGAGHFDCQRLTLSSTATDFDFTLPNSDSGFHVSNVSPKLNATNTSLNSGLVLEFSQNLDPATVTAADFSITPASGALLVQVDGNQITVQPALQFPRDQNVLVELTGAITSQAGTPLAQPLRWRFRTAPNDIFPPVLMSTDPLDHATGFAPNQALSFSFGEALAPKDAQLTVTSAPAAELNISVAARAVIIDAVGGWQINTAYTVHLTGVADAAGNRSTQTFTLHFTTGSQPAPFHDNEPDWNRTLDTIVFSSNRLGGYDIFSIKPDGTNLLRLTSLPGDELHPGLSSDGALLCFQKLGSGGDWDVYVQGMDGGTATAVTSSGYNDTEPVFSRTSSRDIFFISDRTGSASIFSMHSDGSNPSELDRAFGGGQSDPAPHPLLDRQLLFTADRNNNRSIWHVSISAVDGSVVNTNVTENLVSNERQPCWSADASTIGFISNFSGVDSLWISDAAGNFPRQVTDFMLPASNPVIAPQAGDDRCLLSLATADGGTDLVLVDLISGNILLNLSDPGAGN